jgi:hypothetical protein
MDRIRKRRWECMENGPEKTVKDVVVEDFCIPLEEAKKDDCTTYYENWVEKEEEKKRLEEKE